MDFRKAANELLEAMNAFGEQVDENSTLAKSLHACEAELLRIAISAEANTTLTNT